MKGFLFATYEWSEWRNGLFFWLQGIEGDNEVVLQMKTKLENYATEELKV